MDREKIEKVFRELDYDFDEFDIDDFVEFVAQYRQRPILCVPFSFSPGISGAWIRGQFKDFIFFHVDTHPIHQTHIKLHEIAHMLLKHPLKSVYDVLSPELIAELESDGQGHLRTQEVNRMRDIYEQEAEYFVELVQRGVVKAHRLEELTRGGSSIEALRPYVAGLPFDGLPKKKRKKKR